MDTKDNAGGLRPRGLPRCLDSDGGAAFIAYSFALWQRSIWYRRAWSTTIKATVDGLIYAPLTAGTFGWL
jgi:hypothetical protein